MGYKDSELGRGNHVGYKDSELGRGNHVGYKDSELGRGNHVGYKDSELGRGNHVGYKDSDVTSRIGSIPFNQFQFLLIQFQFLLTPFNSNSRSNSMKLNKTVSQSHGTMCHIII